MKVQIEELSPIERKLSIEVEGSRVTEELSRAYSTLGRQVRIAGFRPGKVPRRILEQRFREQVEGDVINRVVQRAYLDAIREHKVEAVSSPTVTNNSELKVDEPFTFQARVEIKPKLDPKDYQGLELKKIEVQIDEPRVDEQLEKLRSNMARLDPLEDRDIAESGDYAVIDYEGTLDGKEFGGSKAENVTVEVAQGEFIESKVAALAGTKIGDVREIDYAFPESVEIAALKGKTAHFKLHLKGLKRRVTPELNDEFAKDFGNSETLAELRGKIRTDLERSERAKAEVEQRDALIKVLVERNPFDVPKSMVDRAVDVMLDGALRALLRSGVDPQQMNVDFMKIRDEMRPRGLAEVQGALLLEAIAEKENLSVNDDEIEKSLEELAGETQQPLPQIRKRYKEPEERRGLALRLREQKTIEFLKAHAKYS